MSAELERIFPGLAASGYSVTRPSSATYNCIAWAASESHRWWEPGAYWPGQPGDDLATLTGLFASLGYVLCNDETLERGHEKIVLYADDGGDWTHAARQLPDGWWTSKLGPAEDIVHRTPAALAGAVYGTVRAVMKRAVS